MPRVSSATRVVSTDHLEGMYSDAYQRVLNAGDPEGPIDALVPWEAAGFFCAAVEARTSHKPTCVYVRPGFGHLTHPGLRYVLTHLGQAPIEG